MSDDIGSRVKSMLQAREPKLSQRDLAEQIEMTPDAFSRSVNGRRSFSSVELAALADALGVDVYYLITGRPDPHRVSYAARHTYASPGQWVNTSADDDAAVLEGVSLAYRQAFAVGADFEQTHELPTEPAKWRVLLGSGFVRDFADRLESCAGIDVVRVPEVKTSYCMSIGAKRHVIVLNATPSWFWENWCIAHELGHLSLDHLDDAEAAGSRPEAQANNFAAELLMPAEEIQASDFSSMSVEKLAETVWEWGVSLKALRNRLAALRVDVGDQLMPWLEEPLPTTQRLLRQHCSSARGFPDPITRRMDDAATRRFPSQLQSCHAQAVEDGTLNPSSLAWMMGVRESVFASAAVPEVDDDALAAALGL